MGGSWTEVLPPCRWLPKILRIDCADKTVLQRLSDELALDRPGWLKWPVAFDLRPDDQGLHESAPHESFQTKALWDWTLSSFVRLPFGAPSKITEGVAIEIRYHPERCSIYVVLLDGKAIAWTHIRNWALLYAYSLKEGRSPFELNSGEPIKRSGGGGIYLPLPLGRLCSVIGAGLSGPKLNNEDVPVEYCYPLGESYREEIRRMIPAQKL
jgi:hypothetical protein